MRPLLIAAFTALGTAACWSPYMSDHHEEAHDVHHVPSPAARSQDIRVGANQAADRQMIVLGTVEAHAHDEHVAMNNLRVRAAALGADAIVGALAQHEHDMVYVTGTAVRYGNP